MYCQSARRWLVGVGIFVTLASLAMLGASISLGVTCEQSDDFCRMLAYGCLVTVACLGLITAVALLVTAYCRVRATETCHTCCGACCCDCCNGEEPHYPLQSS